MVFCWNDENKNDRNHQLEDNSILDNISKLTETTLRKNAVFSFNSQKKARRSHTITERGQDCIRAPTCAIQMRRCENIKWSFILPQDCRDDQQVLGNEYLERPVAGSVGTNQMISKNKGSTALSRRKHAPGASSTPLERGDNQSSSRFVFV